MSLLDLVKEAGVVGAGGAGFPTHVKLAAKAEFMLLNGAECEPLLRVDQQLMALFPEKIIKGLNAAREAVGANKAIVGIKGKHKNVISILNDAINALQLKDFVEIGILPDIYPAGDEQVLVYELVGRVVPEAGIPINVGCVVINSETALNIFNAMEHIPVTETYLTLAGDIPNPITVKVPVGMAIADVIRLCGLDKLQGYSVIDGGPMMGPVMNSLDGYITKKQKGFVILKNGSQLIQRKSVTLEQAKRVSRAACEQCRMCTDLCPRYLLGHSIQPHKTMRMLNYGLDDTQGQKITQLCCQCNLCELFSCPAGLFPRFANNDYKEKSLSEGLRYKPEKTEFNAREVREYRLLPSKRLIARLGLHDYDKPAPMAEIDVNPDMVRILTRQHVGAPAVAAVSAGDFVHKGQMIGSVPENALGAAIHSSIDGIVAEISNDYIEIRRD